MRSCAAFRAHSGQKRASKFHMVWAPTPIPRSSEVVWLHGSKSQNDNPNKKARLACSNLADVFPVPPAKRWFDATCVGGGPINFLTPHPGPLPLRGEGGERCAMA